MRKLLLVLTTFLTGVFAHAQDSLSMVAAWSMSIDATCVWDNDEAGNVYLFRNQAISKLDTNGRQLLTQSTKSIGQVATIDASNWMKIAVFSEEQQQICYLDNALGLLPDCIDLSALGITLAQQFCTSRQTDRIWVYDQLNSELQLITLRSSQRQIVQNLSGLTEIGTIVDMTEHNNNLILLDDKGKVLLLDNFGSLLDAYSIGAQSIFPEEQIIGFSKGKTLYYMTTSGAKLAVCTLPVDGVIRHYAIVGKRILVSTDTMLYSFRAGE